MDKMESSIDNRSFPGFNSDVYFGDAETPLPNWREVLPEDSDDDELSPEEYADVVGMIGFDPKEKPTEKPVPHRIKPSPFKKRLT